MNVVRNTLLTPNARFDGSPVGHATDQWPNGQGVWRYAGLFDESWASVTSTSVRCESIT